MELDELKAGIRQALGDLELGVLDRLDDLSGEAFMATPKFTFFQLIKAQRSLSEALVALEHPEDSRWLEATA